MFYVALLWGVAGGFLGSESRGDGIVGNCGFILGLSARLNLDDQYF